MRANDVIAFHALRPVGNRHRFRRRDMPVQTLNRRATGTDRRPVGRTHRTLERVAPVEHHVGLRKLGLMDDRLVLARNMSVPALPSTSSMVTVQPPSTMPQTIHHPSA